MCGKGGIESLRPSYGRPKLTLIWSGKRKAVELNILLGIFFFRKFEFFHGSTLKKNFMGFLSHTDFLTSICI